MLLLTIFTLFLQFQSFSCEVLDANGISLAEKVLAIERLMLTPGTIDFQVATCEFLLNGPPPGFGADAGDQTAAEWVRTVFHDFITYNATTKKGGLDASVGFESGRPENLGNVFGNQNFIDRTIFGFNLFSSVFISTSDFIALGMAEAVLSCDPNSPMIKLRAGRIDATEAGPFGVPGPSDSLVSQQAAFANAGFSKTEMIQAVACGHSIGGVHNINFPQIVGNQPVSGSSEVDSFDDTPFIFDNLGIQRYLTGVGKAGGPLVTTSNAAFRSDLHIFESDNNATIRAMATSQQAFENACFPIFQKMIDTVPKGVTLSDVIGPRKWITMASWLDLDSTNAVTYSGTIGTYGKTAAPQVASYFYGTEGGGNTGNPKFSQPGVAQPFIIVNDTDSEGHSFQATRFPFFGNTTFYNFTDTFNSPTITSLNIEGTYTEAINLNLFILPSMSYVNQNLAQPQYLVRAALLTKLSPTGTTLNATLYYPTALTGTLSPGYKQKSVTLTSFTTRGSYTIFQGVIIQPADPASIGGGSFHVDVKLGTTQRSPKVQAVGNPGTNLFIPCTKSDVSQCP